VELETNDLGINELKTNDEEVSVYPNPNAGKFHVFCHSEQSEESQSTIKIYNVLAESVLTETLRFTQGDNALDLSGQPNGVYLYRVIAQDGSLIGTGKVVIQK
jgi:hypothetical protein